MQPHPSVAPITRMMGRVSWRHPSKGECNGKSGNTYLAWAYVEAATFAVRHSPEIRAWFQRKQARSGKRVIAIKALANKMAKACYFMLRDGKDFDVKRLTG